MVRAAEIATILPVGFDAEGNGIEGEIIGTGILEGAPDTTYILSGETAGDRFTCTPPRLSHFLIKKLNFTLRLQ